MCPKPSAYRTITIGTKIDGEERKDFNLSKCIRFQDFFITKRGEIINVSNDIEEMLLFAIQIFLSTSEEEIKEYQQSLEKPTEFTFMDKWKRFRELFNKKDEIKSLKNEYPWLKKAVHEAINIRDKYTHGKLFFQEEDPMLEYYSSSGEKKSEKLSESKIEEDISMLNKCLTGLNAFDNKIIQIYGKDESKSI